jgi:hypothetical protein
VARRPAPVQRSLHKLVPGSHAVVIGVMGGGLGRDGGMAGAADVYERLRRGEIDGRAVVCPHD